MAKLEYERFVVQGIERGGFNGAIHPVGKDRFLCVYRNPEKKSLSATYLNNRYVSTGKIEQLPLGGNEDPRIFQWRGGLFMSTCYAGPVRQEIWPIYPDRAEGLIKDSFHFYFDGVANWPGYSYRWEKNWQPLSDMPLNDILYFEYSICPRRVVAINPFRNEALLWFEKQWTLPDWFSRKMHSELRLSVPAVMLNIDCWLGMWHFRNEQRGVYYSGFYTFSSDFHIHAMSGAPVFDVTDTAARPVGDVGIRLIFPQSMQVDGDLVRVCGGMNGSAVVVYHFSLKDILDSLELV